MELIKDEYIIALKEWLEYAISSGQEKVSIELTNNKLTFRCIPGEFIADGNKIIEKTHRITIPEINDSVKKDQIFVIHAELEGENNPLELARKSLKDLCRTIHKQ